MIFCFQSKFRRNYSSTVFIVAWALTLFRCPNWALSSTLQSSFPHNVKLPNRKTYAKFSIFLRFRNFENIIFHNCGELSQPHVFPWHPTPCWRCDRLEQTALAQVPEETLVQKQPSLQPSRLIFSSFGQHECCNRTYGEDYVVVGIHIRVKCVIRHSVNRAIWWHINTYIVVSTIISMKCVLNHSGNSDLKIHQCINSSEPPYTCEVCNKAFRLKCLLVTSTNA